MPEQSAKATMNRFSDQGPRPVLVVSGGTSGIGRAVCAMAVRRGYKVAALYHANEHAARHLTSELQELPGEFAVYKTDIRSETSVDRVIAQILTKWNRIDVLVNSAAVNRRAPFLDGSVEDWRAILDTNVLGCLILSRAVARAMVKQGEGRIINLSSAAAEYALGDRAVYEASKAAVNRLTKSLANELSPNGVQVNAISPGLIRTPMTEAAGEQDLKQRVANIPAGRLGEIDEVANLLMYFASDAPPYITGVVMPIDGGRTT